MYAKLAVLIAAAVVVATMVSGHTNNLAQRTQPVPVATIVTPPDFIMSAASVPTHFEFNGWDAATPTQ